MTKKDYEKFAELLAIAIANNWSARTIAKHTSNLFASENPNFNSAKFSLAIEKQVSECIIGNSVGTR
jgi:hypothetical protein